MNTKPLLKKHNWKITYEQPLGHFMVIERGYTVLIIYPKSDKYKEKGSIKLGIRERIKNDRKQ